MTRKSLVPFLIPATLLTLCGALCGCGGSPNAKPPTGSPNIASAARPRSPDAVTDERPATTDDSPTDSSRFDPHRFELPAPPATPEPSQEPPALTFPATTPESTPPTATPDEALPLESPFPPESTAAGSPPPAETSPPAETTPPAEAFTPETRPAATAAGTLPGERSLPPEASPPETSNNNPLRRPIARPSAVAGPNKLRAFAGLVDSQSAFSPPVRSTDPDEPVASDDSPPPTAAIAPTTPNPSDTSTPSSAFIPPTTPAPPPPAIPIATAAPPAELIQPLLAQPSGAAASADHSEPNPPDRPATDFAVEARAGSADTANGSGRSPPPAKSVHEVVAADDPNSPFTTVRVFYATDRAAEDATSAALETAQRSQARRWVLILGATALVGAGLCIHRGRRITGGILATSAVAASIFVFVRTSDSKPQLAPESASLRVAYRNDRGNLELGQCEVTIPKIHKDGQVERPEVWRLEFKERDDKHMILKTIERRAPDVFFSEVRERVKQSPTEDLFVFVHGYNVSFETAALRTAQMAKDLDFQGAPIFYSWPSQGGLLRYTVDENNVTWTVPHLKRFLGDLAEKSDAKAIHLIAHSMGNRALTAALRELAYESRDRGLHFQQIVLAAPDIDAEVFRRDLAPVLSRSADRVTLYASSNDQALAASKLVHGYPRAGDSGRDLVVVPGIETIDVSAADTSLLGHSYYGSSEPILHDLKTILGAAKPASVRPWLERSTHDGHPYWVFDIRSAALPGPSARR